MLVPAGALRGSGPVVPMAGRWHRTAEGLRFVPRLPFAGGVTYVLLQSDGAEVARIERVATVRPPTTSVLAIHPDVAEVPENLLRLSITFSAPMDEGSTAAHVQLEDPDGNTIPQALLPMPPELWDRERRRLTLLLEPGRIKRGLVPNTALGAPLAGRRGFSIVVSAALRDATGAALTAEARRDYRVGPAIRSRIDPTGWRVRWPSAGSEEPLVVDLDRPLDRALALRRIRPADVHGRPVAGTPDLGDGATRWRYLPDGPWPDGLRLRVGAALEDLAGNSVRRVFDRDLRLAEDAPLDVDELVLVPGR